MARRRTITPPRKMKPAILVVCEGETEEAYLDFLRHQYRCPIKIVSKILGDDINERRIKSLQDSMKVSGNDIVYTFLMYDRDVAAMNDKIDKLSGVKLCSNPCVELWFLLHISAIHSPLTTKQCIEHLRQHNVFWGNYEKAFLSLKQKECLWSNRLTAVSNAKLLLEGKNPSSTVYRLIEFLETKRK